MKFTSSSKDLLAVDFSGNHIKILRAQPVAGKLVYQDVFYKKQEQISDAEVMQDVLNYFKKQNVSAREVVCVIPSKLFISKNVEIPSTEKEEIAKIIDLQAGRFTPYSRDEIVIDFLCMDTPTQHYTSVLLIIVNRSLVDRYCRLFEDIGISIKIAISSEAMAATYADILGVAGPEAFALGGLCIGEDATDFTVMDHHQVVFVRSLPVGHEHFQAGKDLATTELINELNKSLAAYQDQQAGKPLQSLILTGLGGDAESLKEAIEKSCPVLQRFNTQIHLKDVRRFFQAAPLAIEQMDSFKDVSFFELMASLQKAEQTHINLIPKEIKLKRRFREQSREITSLGITLMTIFIVFSLFLYTKIYFKNVHFQKITQAGKSTFDEARMLERVSTKNRVVRKILKMRGKGLMTFDEVTGLLGESTYLSSFTYDMEGRLNLGGTAESMSQVFALVNRLEASNHYASVKATETKSRREGTKDVADFGIECILPDSAIFEKMESEKSAKKTGSGEKK